MVTATTLKPMYFSNSFSNCFSWQNFFFSSIINCWRAVRINTPASKKPSNDRSPLPRGAEWRRRVWAWAQAGGEAWEGAGPGRRWPCWGGEGDLLTSSASGRSWVSSSYPRYVVFFWVTALAAAHLQLQIQAACEIMNSLRADCETQARNQRTHTQGSVTH